MVVIGPQSIFFSGGMAPVKQKNIVLVVVAVVCGLIAAFLTTMGAKGKKQEADTVQVPVAIADLPVGTRLKAEDLEKYVVMKALPKDAVPPNSVEQTDFLKDKRLTRTVRQGQSFGQNDVTTNVFLNPPPGHSVMSVTMSTVEAASGFIGPGAHVDIIASVLLKKSQKWVVFPLFLDMLVLAVNSESAPTAAPNGATPNVGMVSLAVTAEQQLLLQGSISRGATMRMGLRHPDNPSVHRAMKADEIWDILSDKIEEKDKEQLAPPAPITPAVEMVKVKVPTVDLLAGTLITDDLIAKSFKDAEYPLSLVPETAVKELKSYAANGDYLLKDLPANYFIPKTFFGPKPKEEQKLAKVGPDGTGATPKNGEVELLKPVPPKPVYVEVTLQTPKGVVKYRYQKMPNGDHKYVGVVRPESEDDDSKSNDGKGEKKPEESGGSKGPFTAP